MYIFYMGSFKPIPYICDTEYLLSFKESLKWRIVYKKLRQAYGCESRNFVYGMIYLCLMNVRRDLPFILIL